MAAYAAVGIDDLGGVGGLAILAVEEESVDDGVLIGLGIAGRAVRPEAFPGDDVEGAVAIDVGEIEGVRLGEGDSGGAFFRGRVGEEMAFPCAVRVLLIPGDAEAVGVDGGDHIGASVAVHVSSEHLRAAFIAKGCGMKFP